MYLKKNNLKLCSVLTGKYIKIINRKCIRNLLFVFSKGLYCYYVSCLVHDFPSKNIRFAQPTFACKETNI